MKVPVHTLSQTEQEHIAFIAKNVCPPTTSNEFWEALDLAKANLPDSVFRWREDVLQHDAGLLTNCAIDLAIPPTPVDMFQKSKEADCWERLSALLSQLFGECLCYQGKVYPGVVHDVFPLNSKTDKELGAGYSPLAWHVEDGFFDTRPDWLSLYCLRGDGTTETYVARVDDFDFSSQEETELYTREFTLAVDTSFEEKFQKLKRSIQVLKRSLGETEIIFDPAFMTSDNSSSLSLLDKVRKQANSWKYVRILTQGDFLVLNNRKCVHARGNIQRSVDIKDRRWLKRCCVWERIPLSTNNRQILFDHSVFK